jgi:sec-independent protein translocase protein TatB
MGIGGWEILVILLVVLLVFGPRRIPGVARDMGKAMRELRRVGTEFQRELNLSDLDEEPKPPARLAAPLEGSASPSAVPREAAARDDDAPPRNDVGPADPSRRPE